MKPDYASEFAGILRRNHIDFIFVGAKAIFRRYPSQTFDFDVMVLARDFARGVAAVDKDPSVASMSRSPVTMPGGHVIIRGPSVRFVLLDPAAYAGACTGEDFYAYVRRYASDSSPTGRIAKPAVVWYMRLVIDRHELYVPKMVRELRAGVPWSTVDEVRRIAKRFGVDDLIACRIRTLSEVAEIVKLR